MEMEEEKNGNRSVQQKGTPVFTVLQTWTLATCSPPKKQDTSAGESDHSRVTNK